MHPSKSSPSPNLQSLKHSSFSIAVLVVFSLFVAAIGVYLTFFSGAASIRGDINNDNKVDIADLSLLLSSYGIAGSKCQTNAAYTCDLSSPSDNKVDIADLSALLTNYGKVGSGEAITFTKHCTLSAGSVIQGNALSASATLQNTSGASITLKRVVLTTRAPGDSNANPTKGAFDMDPQGTNITIAAGASYNLSASRTFNAPEPTGAWRCYVTYQDQNDVWHDDVSTNFSVTAPVTPPPGSMAYGVVTGGDTNAGVALAQNLGAHIARSYDTDPFASPASLDNMFLNAANRQVELILLIDIDGKGSAGNVGQFAARFGPGGTFWQAGQPGAGKGTYAMRYMEWGNENSFGYKGGPGGGDGYANLWMQAYNAVHAGNANVKLLAQGEDGGSGSSAWLDGMFRAQPTIGSKVGCWVIHPYGPPTSGMDKLDRMVRTQLPAHGVTNAPVCITEDGISTDNGNNLNNNYNWPTNMTYAQAATGIKSKVSTIKSREYGNRVIVYTQYASRDGRPSGSGERESYFGIFKYDNSEKGPFTQAARDLAALYKAH